MFIYNVTFLLEKDDTERFLVWMRGEGLESLTDGGRLELSPRLAAVVEVPGDPDFGSQARSIALQVEFSSLEEAHAWGGEMLAPVLASYEELFGPQALSFVTVLETIDL